MPVPEPAHTAGGLVASPQVLSLVVALLCFLIAAGFLLFLVPEPRRTARRRLPARDRAPADADAGTKRAERPRRRSRADPGASQRLRPLPLGGLGQPRTAPAARLPVEGADGTHFIDAAEVRSVRADAHYTLVHDGSRERMCPWSISEAEAQLDPALFMRVHRSHIVVDPACQPSCARRATARWSSSTARRPHRVPVSRAKIAELQGAARPREAQGARRTDPRIGHKA